MDGKRFDELTRVMGAGASRRSVIKGLAVTVGGGLVALAGKRMGALAATGDPCSASSPCPSGYCVPNAANSDHATDATAGYCEECNPGVDASFVCADGQFCNVSGNFGVCEACACAANETCDPVGGACTCENTSCNSVCCAAGEVCDVAGNCAVPGTLHSPCAAGDTCDAGLYCIQGNCDVCSQDPVNACPNGLYCDVSGYWAACVDLCEVNSVTCGDNETCNPGTGDCDCNANLCLGTTCCAVDDNCSSSGCKAPSALGGVCADNDPCAAGLFCIPNPVNPDNATDASAGFCEECNPDIVAEAVCANDQFCNVSGQFGVCEDCDCGDNEVCDPVGGICSCPNVACGAVCCDAGMLCGDGDVCVECLGDGDCISGEICQDNVCVGVECTSDEMCNTEAGQICDETDHTCQCANETCGAGTAKVCCAEGEVCNADGNCSTSCKADKDCASGEHCDKKVGYCVANECAKDTDCPGTKVCTGGICVAQCSKDSDCASGDVCTDGSCAAGEGESGGGESGGEEGSGVTELPSTGVGRGKSGGSSWLGAAMIGGAAAYLAGKKLRQDATPTDVE
jgi:hypothetical protein